jgi:putative ABC transport system permease protein
MDFKYAIRSLKRSPGLTAAAVAVLALGIGANTAIFSVVNAVILQPLAYEAPDRIMSVATLWVRSGNRGQVSGPDFHDWHNQNTSFEALASYQMNREAIVTETGPERDSVAQVSPEFFKALGVETLLGRLFTAEEARQGAQPTVVIGHAFWKRNFRGDAGAIGKTVKSFGRSFTIIGVLPDGFQFPAATALWFPANSVFPETESRTAHNYRVVGRLKPGVSPRQAQSEMTAIGARLAKQYPENSTKSVSVLPMQEQMVRGVRPTLYVFLAAVVVVLLIACANVANLLLAKGSSRRREIAVRAAVGASSARIVRQLMIESIVLALAGGAVGFLLATWGAAALVALAPASIPRINDVHMDVWVLAFTVGASLIASLIFGLLPALRASKTDLNEALKEGGTRTVIGGSSGSMRSALVISEIALSCALLVSAGLLIKSFLLLTNTDPGYRTERLLAMDTVASALDRAGAVEAMRFYERLLNDAARLPGVEMVSATRDLPSASSSNGTYFLEGRPAPKAGDFVSQQAGFMLVAPRYFETLGIPLRHGRDFTERDRDDPNALTCIINDAVVRESFRGEDPLGKRMQLGLDRREFMTIVGVVGDMRQDGLDQPPSPQVYMPYVQHPGPATSLKVLVRTAQDSTALAGSLRELAHSLNPEVPVSFTTLRDAVSASIAPTRFRTLLLGLFAGLAVALALVGLYGVTSYLVTQRLGEIGVRVALGARPGDIVRLIMRHGAMLTAAGLVIGIAGALAAGKLLAGFLYGVKAADPVTFAVVAAVLAGVALLASYIPARRAARVDPLTALRHE